MIEGFDWNPSKNDLNERQHGIRFEEAKELFVSDVDRLEIYDEAHSHDEERFIAIGPIRRGVIAVVWTERDENVIRIISARFATSKERALYRKYAKGRT